MSYLIAEILISLIVIAVIGGVIGWIMRGLGHEHIDADTEEELAAKTEALSRTKHQLEKVSQSVRKLHQARDGEIEKLRQRIKELEPLFDIVEQRDKSLRKARADFETFKIEKDAEIETLKMDLGTRNLVHDETEESAATISRLQYELKLATRQKDSAIQRYQDQVRTVETLEKQSSDREGQVVRLKSDLDERRKQYEMQMDLLETSIRELRDQVLRAEEQRGQESAEIEEQLARLRSAESEVEHREKENVELRGRLDEMRTSESALKSENEELRASLEKQVQENAALQAHPVRTAPMRPSSRAELDAELSGDESEVDDLKVLKGIGPAIERSLNRLGITTLRQLASLSDEDVDRIGEMMPQIKSSLRKYNWIESASQELGQQMDHVGTA